MSPYSRSPTTRYCKGQGVFFFVVAPFCSCPASLVSRIFFCCRPRVCKVSFFLLRSVGRRDLSAGPEQKKNTTQGVFFCSGPGERPGCFFFFLWPLFARAPRHWFLEFFLLSAPGVQSVFFFVALRWAPRPFGGARAKKKNTTKGVLFFCSGPGERQGKEKPRAGTGPEQKKNTTQGVFFLLRPRGKAREGEAPLGAGTGP